jgi:hypothetical protein
MFAKYLFIKKMKLGNFKYNFPRFQQLGNKYAKYIFCCVFVIIIQWFGQ